VEPSRTHRSLALVIDGDHQARGHARGLLESLGYDVVHASTGLAGLELIQRLPRSFALVLADLDIRGLPGAVVLETLRLFRPDLPVLCMSGRRAEVTPGCLGKPLVADTLASQVRELTSGALGWSGLGLALDGETVSRVKAHYAQAGDLAEAALELSKGFPGEN
jgi:CheY-like chemotaxis protein